MEAFLSAPIQTILSDNGSEFEGEFARVAENKDIIRFYTHPNCPQQKLRGIVASGAIRVLPSAMGLFLRIAACLYALGYMPYTCYKQRAKVYHRCN